jgi:O-antigen/teichoic acid export membrane protein
VGDLSRFLVERVCALVASYMTEAGRRALRNLIGLLAWTALWQASALGSLLLLSLGLAPEQFGMLSFALTAQTYLVLLGSLGCGSIVIREGIQRPSDLDAILTSFLTLTATSSALVCAGSLLVVSLAPVSGEEGWLLSLVAMGSIPASMNLQPLFDIHHDQARGVSVGAVAEALGLLAVVLLWRSGALTLRTLGGVYAVKWSLAWAGQLLVYHAGIRRMRWRRSPGDTRRILRLSWPILFASLLFLLPLGGGVLLVRLRSGPTDAALIGLAYQAASAYLTLASLGLQVVQPHIAGPYGLYPGFLRKLALFAGLLLGCLAALALAVGWAVLRLLPPVYGGAIVPMAWLLAAAGLLLIARLSHMFLIRFEDGPFILGSHFATALVYVGGCSLISPPWLRTGAAVLAPWAVLIATGACLWRVRRRIAESPSG